MAGKNKFGAFAGVFTPSILTILGVIMYMRMGWVVGNAGLIGTIIIIVIAHVISISTGVSLSSIATDKKVGAGGIYYILSRSMGIPIGGAIGITLYIGTAFSIALYLIGFAESFNGYFGFDTSINGFRISGTIGLLILTSIALISTSVALKTQFFILAAIIISLISIGLGSNEFAPESIALFSNSESVPLEIVFAIFFPAVTGFTAGVAMSGDLKDPKKSLPVGTIASIAVGFFVYIALAFFLSYYIDSETLRSDYNILMKIAKWAPAVVAGIWGATLSSALGGILGGPRILQAMSIDKVTPKFFGKGKGENNEPVNALLLVFVIAQAGILIGELDVIARVVSMFYLAAYGFINLSFFLEKWANPDFQPTFKVNRWFGLLGFIASFGIMFKLDMIAMFGAIVIIIGIYLLLQRKQLALETGDVWQSVWENIVAKGLKKLNTKEADTSNNWNPNIILFSGESEHRNYLLELSDTISGRTGIVTNFKLILDKGNAKPLKKVQQIVKEKSFDDLGMFARQVKVDNIYKGIENIASTFGFSGVEPNTVMMGWPRKLNKSADYNKMTQTLLQLDYNLLYLDFDKKAQFGNYQTVDLWWRETDSTNAEMMLNIVRFITQSNQWNKAKIRVLFVNHNNTDSNIIKSKIENLVEKLRVKVEIIIINNGVEQKSFYDIIGVQSAQTDLTLIGIPNLKIEKQTAFITNTTSLFKTIGSTLMIKASKNFNELDFDLTLSSKISIKNKSTLRALPIGEDKTINNTIIDLDMLLIDTTSRLSTKSLSTISSFYSQFLHEIDKHFNKLVNKLDNKNSIDTVIPDLQMFFLNLIDESTDFRENKLQTISELLYKEVNVFQNKRYDFIDKASKKLILSQNKKIKWKAILSFYFSNKITPHTQQALYNFGVQNFILISTLVDEVSKISHLFIENIKNDKPDSLSNFKEEFNQWHKKKLKTAENLLVEIVSKLQNFDRDCSIELIENLEKPNFFKSLLRKNNILSKKEIIEKKDHISWFGTHWYKNQVLSHNQVETGLFLSKTGMALSQYNEAIKTHLIDSMIGPQETKIKTLVKLVSLFTKGKITKLDEQTIEGIREIAKGISQVNLSKFLEEEEKSIINLSLKAPHSVKLMDPSSFNVLLQQQNDSVETININISTIQNYILQHNYLAKLQENLKNIEGLYNQNSEDVYNSANRLLYILESLESDTDWKENEKLIGEIQEKIKLNQSNLKNINDLFVLDLKTNLHHTIDDLNIRKIIDSAELLEKAAFNPVIKTKLQNWIINKKDSFNRFKDKIIAFINQHQSEIDSQKFEIIHRVHLNKIERTFSFISEQNITSKTEKHIPFYYKKLFTGSHLSNTSITKRIEYQKAKKALDRINSGVSGAILIIGGSLSGKTFLSEAIARIPKNIAKNDINPPSNQTFTSNDLHRVFQKLFKKKGTSLRILNSLKKKRVFVINDLEKWWNRSANGGKAINYLADLIEKTGDKHIFIINVNIHSYPIIKETTTIEKQLLSSIIMRPYNKNEIKNIILNRHKIGGAKVYYKNELIIDSIKISKLINKIHKLSQGTIGVSLRTWLQLININSENELQIDNPIATEFPKIENANWKLVLETFVLHRRLSESQLKLIFKEETKDLLTIINEMEKAGLVSKQADAYYILDDSARYYIEKYLKTLSLI